MDVYGVSSGAEYFPIDELLDFSNDEIFSSSAASSSTDSDPFYLHPPQLQNPPSTSASAHFRSFQPINYGPTTTDFTNDLYLPSDDVAELEWLSRFADDSFNDFPENELDGGNFTFRSDTSFSGGRARTKRSKEPNASWTSSQDSESQETGKSKPRSKHGGFGDRGLATTTEGGVRRCTHCASERTPQWRTGPLGPKTLCNACGVRYKSGRLVPEYRPASSPTFVLTQHSNSHRKVLELRRQKELMSQQ